MKRTLCILLCICMILLASSALALEDYELLIPYPSPEDTPDPTPSPTPVSTPSPLAPLPTPTSSDAVTQSLSQEDLYLGAKLIYAEGKAQSDESFLAMACVLYNRLASKKFPNTMEGVVFQANQFTVTRNREKFDALVPSERALNAIVAVFVNGERPLPAEVMFFKSARLKKAWGKRVYYDTIGNNMYYS